MWLPRSVPARRLRGRYAGCEGEAKTKTLGVAQTHLENFWKSFLRTFKTLTQLDFGFCFYVVQILSVAIFRATDSGCYEPNPVERDLDGGNLLPCLLSATG